MMRSFLGKNSTTNFAEYSDIFAIFESAYTRIKIIPDGWLLIEITLLRAVARGKRSETKDENKELGKKDENKKIQNPEIEGIPSTRDDRKKETGKQKKIEDSETSSG